MARFAVTIPFYATGLRGEQLREALSTIARHAVRYGAVRTSAYRSQEDAYGFLLVLHFEGKLDWQRFWHSDEFVGMRTEAASWFQKPLQYEMQEILVDEAAPGRSSEGERSPASGATAA